MNYLNDRPFIVIGLFMFISGGMLLGMIPNLNLFEIPQDPSFGVVLLFGGMAEIVLIVMRT